MFRSILLRGVSAGALSLVVSSTIAHAQQSLPTIDVGAARRSMSARPTAAPRSEGQPTGPSTSVPAASNFPSEPKTPAEGYVVRSASTGTKTDVPIRQTPVSVNVVPKQVIQDQNDTNLQEALENVPGVRSNNNELEGYNFKIRGFQSLYIYRNNLAIPAGESNPSTFDTANLERIEVLKGPASILYGRAEPGGLINLVTKEPLDRPRYVIEQQIGSFDHYRTQWDVSSPVEQIPGLAYRVSGAYQNNGSFRGFSGGGERYLIAPVVSYRPSTWTEFTVEGQYLGQKAQSDVGIPPIGPNPAPIPLSRSFQEANDPRDRIESYNIGYKFRQNLNEDWKVTNRFLYTDTPNFQKPNITPLCVTLFCVDTDGRTLQRVSQYQSITGRAYSTNIDLEGKFTALGGKHNFLMGLDYLNGYYNYYYGNGAALYPIDIYNPFYGTVPPFAYFDSQIGSGFKFHSSVLNRQKGFYIQDHVTWFERLHLLLGARYDVADLTQGSVFSFGGDYSASKDLAIANRLRARTRVNTSWSPRAGLVYDLLPELSVYGSYSQSFGINYGVDANGEGLGPQRGKQWEVGLKAEPLPGLTANLAFFQITKSGVPTRDFSSPLAVKLAGLQRSRGIELDVIGRVTERLSLVGNYAYIDAKVISDNPVNRLNPFGTLDPAVFGEASGLFLNHLDNVPRHSGKVFLTYDFGDNGLGWRVGGGVTASTRAWGNIQNTFLLPGWARLDGFASYTTLFEGHKMTAQLNLHNINNAQYFTGADTFFNGNGPPQQLFAAKPFTATGTIRVEF
ncbi:MAG: TonB-dependent siderophore receptor [Methylocystis sp.]|uniref:TonB-dependent siderophore receptor n=1 Tax=Methylocystis sp. TaxID=1911079 RepID=UPI003DA461E6